MAISVDFSQFWSIWIIFDRFRSVMINFIKFRSKTISLLPCPEITFLKILPYTKCRKNVVLNPLCTVKRSLWLELLLWFCVLPNCKYSGNTIAKTGSLSNTATACKRVNLLQVFPLQNLENFISLVKKVLKIHRLYLKCIQSDLQCVFYFRKNGKNDGRKLSAVRSWISALKNGILLTLNGLVFLKGRLAALGRYYTGKQGFNSVWHTELIKMSGKTLQSYLLLLVAFNHFYSLLVAFSRIRSLLVAFGRLWSLFGRFWSLQSLSGSFIHFQLLSFTFCHFQSFLVTLDHN